MISVIEGKGREYDRSAELIKELRIKLMSAERAIEETKRRLEIARAKG